MEITRREVMIGAGAAIAAAKTVTSFPAVAQTGPLKIGIYISEQDDQGVR